jgi:hypothetical protein
VDWWWIGGLVVDWCFGGLNIFKKYLNILKLIFVFQFNMKWHH